MAGDGYSYRDVYKRVDKEIERAFIKAVNTPSKSGDFVFEPKARIHSKVKLF